MESAKGGKKHFSAERNLKYVWRNIILFTYLHLASLYGLYLCVISAKIATVLFAMILYKLGSLGITAGAHRLWSHRCYRAKWPLRLFLMIINTLAFQDSVIDWARDHRVHHKFTETDADPYNSRRGFFFCHVGWLLVRKHPEVLAKGQNVDLSDLYADPIIRFQKRYYLVLMVLLCFITPTIIPVYIWKESFHNSWHVCSMLRYCFTLNVTWLVNSAAHMWGRKPYDKTIHAAENLLVSILAFGEGWHNYHHVFPWDYKTAELGCYAVNETTLFLDLMARCGQAYELKTVSEEMVRKRVLRSGDGTHAIWGWGDKQQTDENRQMMKIDGEETK